MKKLFWKLSNTASLRGVQLIKVNRKTKKIQNKNLQHNKASEEAEKIFHIFMQQS